MTTDIGTGTGTDPGTDPDTAMPGSGRAFDPRCVTSRSFWAHSFDEREAVFRQLRDEAPVSWQPPMDGGLMESEQPGLWVVTRHADIAHVSKNPAVFGSAQGVQFEDVPEDLLEASHSFLAMDAPRHQQLRRLVSAAFTPKQVRRIDAQIHDQAVRIVDGLLAAGEGDFVELVSQRLPMWTVYEMMGLDPILREEAARFADEMVSYNDPDVLAGREAGEVINGALVSLLTMGLEFAAHRREHPGDDLMTNLVQAEVDGERLSDDDIAAFFVLISVAGNDTTRNTISVATHALQQHPDQRRLLLDDFDGRIGTAVDEFLRWVSPVMTFRRTALVDTELGGRRIAAGEWVAMVYTSGNRDERVFDRPDVLDLTRSPNPHQGFGGGGPHFCLGNVVAKTQLREVFGQLLRRVPDLEVGEPEVVVGSFVRAVKSMPCTTR